MFISFILCSITLLVNPCMLALIGHAFTRHRDAITFKQKVHCAISYYSQWNHCEMGVLIKVDIYLVTLLHSYIPWGLHNSSIKEIGNHCCWNGCVATGSSRLCLHYWLCYNGKNQILKTLTPLNTQRHSYATNYNQHIITLD